MWLLRVRRAPHLSWLRELSLRTDQIHAHFDESGDEEAAGAELLAADAPAGVSKPGDSDVASDLLFAGGTSLRLTNMVVCNFALPKVTRRNTRPCA